MRKCLYCSGNAEPAENEDERENYTIAFETQGGYPLCLACVERKDAFFSIIINNLSNEAQGIKGRLTRPERKHKEITLPDMGDTERDLMFDNRGHPHSQETKEKIRKTKTGQKYGK